jgi:hypothetical protein
LKAAQEDEDEQLAQEEMEKLELGVDAVKKK